VVRSLLVLRVLTHGTTGGIVAAPTTSLPERLGGPRNWDYRFCWLRDASLTLEALLRSGYDEEIVLWRNWLLRAVAGDPQDMQIMYVVDGSRELPRGSWVTSRGMRTQVLSGSATRRPTSGRPTSWERSWPPSTWHANRV
jgi:GH15 family glucan-1,4-alpha-glucosidase